MLVKQMGDYTLLEKKIEKDDLRLLSKINMFMSQRPKEESIRFFESVNRRFEDFLWRRKNNIEYSNVGKIYAALILYRDKYGELR